MKQEDPTISRQGTAFSVLVIISLSHFLNDMIQSVVPSIYPMLKEQFKFSFAQIGMITFAFQMASSILQPLTGIHADKHPRPFSLAVGMCFTLAGILLISISGTYGLILISVSIIGLGSSVFHPEASRVTQLASGGKKSLAQSIFQVGGNSGAAIGPLLAACIVIPFGQRAISIFSLAAIAAILLLMKVGVWYKLHLQRTTPRTLKVEATRQVLSQRKKWLVMGILVVLVFSKYFYTSCITNYFTFFLINKFGMSVANSQLCLFAFLAAFAIGTLVGGTLGDRFGRKYIIWFSILGAAPFALAMPYMGLHLTIACAFMASLIIASAFSSIVVYATDIMPDKVGLISGVFFGLMFGLGGIGSAFFGWLADRTSIETIFQASAFLPLLGMIAGFLPDTRNMGK